MTSSRLRELSRLASPAPWRVAIVEAADSLSYRHDIDTVVEAGDGDTLIAGMLGPVEMDDPNASLVVALRNDAEKYADLRDAAHEVVAAYDALVSGKPMPSYGAVDRLRAALAAFGGE